MRKIEFTDLRIVDNFYQTSSFYPMPVVLIGTVNKNGQSNFGPYSLCFPYYIAGKDYYAVLLETRNNSNTAVNLLRNPFCTIKFIPGRSTWIGYGTNAREKKDTLCIFLKKMLFFKISI